MEGNGKIVGREWEGKGTGCEKTMVAKEVWDREGSAKGKGVGM